MVGGVLQSGKYGAGWIVGVLQSGKYGAGWMVGGVLQSGSSLFSDMLVT